MLDTRRAINAILGRLQFTATRSLVRGSLCLAFSLGVAYLPKWPDMSPGANAALFILLFAASLWVTEAIPAFAVALLIIGLEIALLGKPDGIFAQSDHDWEMFIEPWASPLIWLFLGGLVLAHGAQKTGLDRWVATRVATALGTRPGAVLFATMGVTFLFSMFMSNTATAAMMVAVIMPVVGALRGDQFRKALLLGVPFAANIGGMGTIIGTPPNAIAVGMLEGRQPIHFAQWMVVGMPPAMVLALVAGVYLLLRYPSEQRHLDLSAIVGGPPVGSILPLWQRAVVMGVFILTVSLWLTDSLHGIPTYVVSFIPARFRGGHDHRSRDAADSWDILILAPPGSLSLGWRRLWDRARRLDRRPCAPGFDTRALVGRACGTLRGRTIDLHESHRRGEHPDSVGHPSGSRCARHDGRVRRAGVIHGHGSAHLNAA